MWHVAMIALAGDQLQRLDDAGEPVAAPEQARPELIAKLEEGERPRWLWASTEHAYLALLSAGVRVRRWLQDKKAGWYAVLEDPQMPVTSTLLDQAHNAIERKLFAMKGFHHPDGSQQAFLTGLAHLYNLIPYQRRAKHAGQCGVEVEGGTVPTRDWLLNLQILTSGGFR